MPERNTLEGKRSPYIALRCGDASSNEQWKAADEIERLRALRADDHPERAAMGLAARHRRQGPGGRAVTYRLEETGGGAAVIRLRGVAMVNLAGGVAATIIARARELDGGFDADRIQAFLHGVVLGCHHVSLISGLPAYTGPGALLDVRTHREWPAASAQRTCETCRHVTTGDAEWPDCDHPSGEGCCDDDGLPKWEPPASSGENQ